MRRCWLIAFSAALAGPVAAAQDPLPPGLGPVPLRRDGGDAPPPPPENVPVPRIDPLPGPAPRSGGGSIFQAPLGEPELPRDYRRDPPPRPPDRVSPLPDPLPGRPTVGGGDGLWPQRQDPERDDQYSPRYRYSYATEEAVRAQPATLSQNRHELDVPVPFLLDKTDLFGASLRVKYTATATRAVLPDTGRLFPKDLWEISAGVGYLHRFDNGWSAGILPRFGTLSDRPFASGRDLFFSAIGFVRIPAATTGDYWNLTLLYFPNQLPYPLPGVAYEWNPDPTLRLSVGLPFSVRWRFAPQWQFDFSYRPLTQINSQISYEVRPGFKVRGEFAWESDGYYLFGRAERKDLFFVQDKRLGAGARVDLAERLTLDVSSGLLFDREFGVGRNSWNTRYDRVDVRRGGYISAQLLLQF